MLRKISVVIVAGLGALSFAGGAAAFSTDAGFPLSVNESGPVFAQRATAPAISVGGTKDTMPMREVRSGTYATYEVQTPSSVSESAPWLTNMKRS